MKVSVDGTKVFSLCHSKKEDDVVVGSLKAVRLGLATHVATHDVGLVTLDELAAKRSALPVKNDIASRGRRSYSRYPDVDYTAEFD